ncbi:uncharacterized protein I206_103607 [Kwoniella pini CBS 10737]|uniref:Uncharacterized protein n=1 Tax=Kwoniella pini CBS 10737 TaxID=1296096 RepID=A0A1B9I9A6_9TREE|nr:uncharacterized protein I206_01390 [Kwoniella pini CBS 10737]OCF52105.1 hypothetical protein I206_01390 [Kwoniella pini CBS 10737]
MSESTQFATQIQSDKPTSKSSRRWTLSSTNWKSRFSIFSHIFDRNSSTFGRIGKRNNKMLYSEIANRPRFDSLEDAKKNVQATSSKNNQKITRTKIGDHCVTSYFVLVKSDKAGESGTNQSTEWEKYMLTPGIGGLTTFHLGRLTADEMIQDLGSSQTNKSI